MNLWKTGALAGAIIVSAGIGAAFVPIAHGQDHEPLVRALQVFGRDAQLGVTVRDAVEGDAKQEGVIVDDVRSGSAAEKAGFKAGDVIVEFDGERVRSVSQFRRLVRETPVGRKVAAAVLRNGQRTTVSVAPEGGSSLYFGDDMTIPRPAMPTRPPEPPRPPRVPRAFTFPAVPGFEFDVWGNQGRLGISVEDLTDQLATYFGVKEGALVRSVRDGSPAAKAGLKAGDVITSINGSRVDEADDVSTMIGRLDDSAEFTIEVYRDKKAQTVKGKLEPRSERIRTKARSIV